VKISKLPEKDASVDVVVTLGFAEEVFLPWKADKEE
jgi:hypothetical protein